MLLKNVAIVAINLNLKERNICCEKTITAVLYCLILLTGCGAQEAASIIPNDAVISPDGKLAVCKYVKEDLEDEKGLLYSIYDVQLYDNEKYIMICSFHIVGRDFHFLWSPNSKYVTAAYSGRIWASFSILDIRRHSTISILGISEILDSFKNSGEKIDYEINEDRSDPYVSPIEWSPDSTRILISYQVKDAGYKTQSGIFIYDLVNNAYSDLRQLPSSEDDHVNIRKPENFSWN